MYSLAISCKVRYNLRPKIRQWHSYIGLLQPIAQSYLQTSLKTLFKTKPNDYSRRFIVMHLKQIIALSSSPTAVTSKFQNMNKWLIHKNIWKQIKRQKHLQSTNFKLLFDSKTDVSVIMTFYNKHWWSSKYLCSLN